MSSCSWMFHNSHICCITTNLLFEPKHRCILYIYLIFTFGPLPKLQVRSKASEEDAMSFVLLCIIILLLSPFCAQLRLSIISPITYIVFVFYPCIFIQIYDAAVRWLKYDVCNRQQYMVEVLGCVRFPLVSKTFLSKTVQGEPLIQDNPQCLKMVISE